MIVYEDRQRAEVVRTQVLLPNVKLVTPKVECICIHVRVVYVGMLGLQTHILCSACINQLINTFSKMCSKQVRY